MLFSLLLACTDAASSPDSGAVADSGTDSGRDTGDVTIDPGLDLVGEPPDAPVPAAPVPDAPAAPAKKARAKSPARAKSQVHQQPGILVGKSVRCMHATHGKKKYKATVVSIIGDWCVIKWEDKDTTDTLKHVDELTLLHDE
jgi:hypothetical protein